jgi:hypothetical protein
MKPRYGKQKLVCVGGCVVVTENVVNVRGITWNIGQLVYTVYCTMSQPTYLLTNKANMMCVFQLWKKLTGLHEPCRQYFAIGGCPNGNFLDTVITAWQMC